MTTTTTSLVLLPFLLLLVASHSSSPLNCTGRYIHILPLPSRFNAALLRNCSLYDLFTPTLCGPSLVNHGLGPRTHNRSRSWYRTDHRLLEPFFHRRLLEYPCLTSSPSIASAVFLPYYASLDALPFLFGAEQNYSASHGLDLFDYLRRRHRRIWSRHSGHDLFLVLAGAAWDYSQSPDVDPPVWGTSFLQIPEFFNITALTLESRPWPWQEQAIPYPTSFHPASLDRLAAWIDRARMSRRRTLMVFAGSGGSPTSMPNVRRSIREECENRTDLCEVVDCSDGKCDRNPIRFMKPMLRAKFCLHPPGDTPTRRATFDGMVAGCVPVFFEDLSARNQYGWHLPPEKYQEFSVTIPKEEVVFGGVSVMDFLRRIPAADVIRMRERVLELVPRITYWRHGATAGLREKKDAFDIAVDGVIKRVRQRVRSLEEGGNGGGKPGPVADFRRR